MLLPTVPLPKGIVKAGDKTIIKIEGHKRECEYVGRGMFSSVWRGPKTKPHRYVFIFTYFGDESKRILYNCQQSPNLYKSRNPHIPSMKVIHDFVPPVNITNRYWRDYGVKCIRSVWYKPLTKQDTRAWVDFMKIKRAYDKHGGARYRTAYQFNSKVVESARVDDSLKEALWQVCDRMADYGDAYYFERPRPKNFRVNRFGKLMLTDPCMNVELVKQSRVSQRNKILYADK